MNTYVGHITRRLAVIDDFTASPSPSSQASEDKGNDDGFSITDADEDDGASSFGDEEMTVSQ